MSPKPPLRFNFQCQSGLPLTFNQDRILKLWRLACLCRCHFLIPRRFKELGVGKRRSTKEGKAAFPLSIDGWLTGLMVIEKKGTVATRGHMSADHSKGGLGMRLKNNM